MIRIDIGYMKENSSYFVTVVAEKHPRTAYFTQEVVIVPVDPPEVEIRYEDRICKKEEVTKYHFSII